MSTKIKKSKAIRYSILTLVAFLVAVGGGTLIAKAQVTEIELTSPTGGEQWRGTSTITWSASVNSEDSTVSILLSSDSGENYNELITGVDATIGEYHWNTKTKEDGSTYRVKVEGDSGVDYSSSNDFTIDNTAPNTSMTVSPDADSETEWYNIETGEPEVTLDCEDSLSGCSGTFYSWETEKGLSFEDIGENNFQEYDSGSITPPEDGEYILYYYSEDNAKDKDGDHNRENLNESDWIKLDTEAPTVDDHKVDGDSNTSYFNPENGNNTMPFKLLASEEVEWTTVRVINVDDTSIYRIYSPTDETGKEFTRDWNGSLDADSFDAAPDEEYSFTYTIEDEAGNENEVKIGDQTPLGVPHIVVDTQDPEFDNVSAPIEDAVYKETNEVPLTFTPTDSGSGELSCSYTVDGDTYDVDCTNGEETDVDVTEGFTDGRNDVVLTVTDAAGNNVDHSTSVVYDNNDTLTVDDDSAADFDNIQEAVNKATAGDTIKVASGNYNEVTVDKPVDLVTEEQATIEGRVKIQSNNIDGNEIVIQGFEITNTDTAITVREGQSDVATTDIIIEDNYIHNVNTGVNGWGYSAYSENWGNRLNSITITENEFSNLGNLNDSGSQGAGVVLETLGDQELVGGYAAIVEDNTFADIYDGENGEAGVGIIVQYKVFTGEEDELDNSAANAKIINNDFTDVFVDVAVGGDVTNTLINENKFSDQGIGVKAANTENDPVDATKNWWGTYVESEIQEKIGGDVDYDPWYMEEEMENLSSDIGQDTVYVDDNYKEGDVCEGCYYGYNAFSSIQEGIDNANSDALVEVADGTYDESLVVDKSLTLQGDGIENTSTVSRGIKISADNVELQGFVINPGEILGETVGVYLEGDLSEVNIHDNEIDGTGASSDSRGVVVASGKNYNSTLLKNNLIHDLNSGIYLNPHSGVIEIQDNEIYNTVAGVGGLNNANVTGNHFHDNDEAMGADSSITETTYNIENNVILDPVNAYAGVSLQVDRNWWGTAYRPNIKNRTSGDVIFDPYWVDAEMTILSSEAVDTVYVYDDYSDGNAGDYIYGYSAFASIQEGIEAVEAGGTVDVSEGTYEENVVIDKPLNLKGEDKNNTTVSPSSGRAIDISAQTAENGYIDGLTIQGFAVEVNDDSIALQSDSAENDGYNGKNYTYKNLVVDANNNDNSAIGLFDVNGVTLDNVEVRNCARTDGGAIEMVGVKNLEMNNSSVHDNNIGLKIFDADGYEANGDITINSSSFAGNDTAIINEVDGLTIEAVDNYWGSENGPKHPANTYNVSDQGDIIEGDVNFVSWCQAEGPSDCGFAPVAIFEDSDGLNPPYEILSTNNFDQIAGQYSSIQQAVEDYDSSDKKIVAAEGTFTEQANINKSDIVLAGSNEGIAHNETRNGETILDGSIKVSANNFKADGMSFKDGADVQAGGLAAVHIVGSTQGHEIINNIFERSGAVDGDTSRAVINEIGGANSMLIENNHFTGWHTGVYLQNAENVEVLNNKMQGNFVGMSMDGGESVLVQGNDFLGNGFEGVGVGEGNGLSEIKINYNQIQGNETGMADYSNSGVNAKKNWWGDESGPKDSYSTTKKWNGTGDSVEKGGTGQMHNINYNPFCTEEPVKKEGQWTCNENLGSSGPLDHFNINVEDQDPNKDGTQVYIDQENPLDVVAKDAEGYTLVNFDEEVQLNADGGASFGDSLLGDNEGEWTKGMAETIITNNEVESVNITALGQGRANGISGADSVEFVHPTGIQVDKITPLNYEAEANGSFENGLQFKYEVTVYNENETNLLVKFQDWQQSNGDGVIPILDEEESNARMLIDESGSAISPVGGFSEDLIENGSGDVESYELGNEYGDQSPGVADIGNIDLSSNTGRQIEFFVFFRIPEETPSGFYTTDYGIKTE